MFWFSFKKFETGQYVSFLYSCKWDLKVTYPFRAQSRVVLAQKCCKWGIQHVCTSFGGRSLCSAGARSRPRTTQTWRGRLGRVEEGGSGGGKRRRGRWAHGQTGMGKGWGQSSAFRPDLNSYSQLTLYRPLRFTPAIPWHSFKELYWVCCGMTRDKGNWFLLLCCLTCSPNPALEIGQAGPVPS